MTPSTALRRCYVYLDRLPAGWVLVLGGFLVHVTIAGGLLVWAHADGNTVTTFVSAVLVGIVVLSGIAALPSFLLLWRGRYPRVGAVLAVLTGLGTLVVNEAHPTVWPFPIALFLAGVRAWAGVSLDTADLLQLDPGRFERVEPGTAELVTSDETEEERSSTSESGDSDAGTSDETEHASSATGTSDEPNLDDS